MFSLNKIMLIGNLGRDAETRFTQNDVSVTTFSIATSRGYKDNLQNWINETTWHNIVGYNLSDYAKGALVRGAKFYVEGRLSKREYTDKQGTKKYVVEVIVEKLFPLGSQGEVSQGEETEPNNEDDGLPF